MSWNVYGTDSAARERYDQPPANLSKSAPSALFGQPAANANDWYIIRGMARLTGIPDGAINPVDGFPLSMQPPPGDASHTSRGLSIIGTAALVIFLVLSITTTRLSLRFFRHDLRFGWDDVIIIPAALGVCVYFSLSITNVAIGGSGQHMYNVTYTEVAWFFKIAEVSQLVYWFTICPVKISIALFNRRLTSLTSKRWMIGHNIFLCILVSYLIAAVISCTFDCIPFTHFSVADAGKLAQPQKCLNLNTLNLSLAAVHIATDFCLLCVPLIVLYKMQMSVTKKIRLGFLFSIGSVACLGSVMRMVVEFQADPDITYASQDMYQWIAVDVFFAIAAASLPVLNAAVPKGWRSPNSIKPLRHLSLLEKGSKPRSQNGDGRMDLETGVHFGRDGTVLEVQRDEYHKRVEKRWDEAYEKSIRYPQPVWHGPCSVDGGSEDAEGRSSSEGSDSTSGSIREQDISGPRHIIHE